MAGGRSRRARVEDVHELARAMPHVTVWPGSADNPVYQVGGKSFIFFRNPRPDAVDPETGARYDDVVVVWVADEGEKQAMVADPATPWFTTRHFDGHLSVLLRTSRIGELTRDEVAERYPAEFAIWRSGREPDREGGETRTEVGVRAAAAVADLPAGCTAILVSHGAAAAALIAELLGLGEVSRRIHGLGNCHTSSMLETADGWSLLSHDLPT